MKILLTVFAIIVICCSIIHHVNAMEFQPNDIFEYHKETRFVLPSRTTGADKLHAEHIEGEIKDDKPLVIAIIDERFHPKYTTPFKEKDLIHPDAFSENLIFDPADALHQDVFWKYGQNKFKKDCIDILTPHYPQEERQDLANLINKLTVNKVAEMLFALERESHNPKLGPLLKYAKTAIYHDEFLSQDLSTHGSGVMEAVHAIAPKACFLPIDYCGFAARLADNSGDGRFAWAIRTAIQYNVDAINLSIEPNGWDSPETIKACKEATDKGIPIIIAAGNDSTNNEAQFISAYKQALFDAVGGNGIIFAGALTYSEDGKEVVAGYTQHPTKKMEKRFICVAGSGLPVNSDSLWNVLIGMRSAGSSFAAPEVAGGYILLKQIARMHNYPATPQELLDILYESGRDVSCRVSLPMDPDSESLIVDPMKRNKTYKSMDLVNAKKMLEEKIKTTKSVSKNSGRPLPPIPQIPSLTVSNSKMQAY